MCNERTYKVLVVEDEPIIQKDIVNEIENTQLGFHVVGCAFNGLDALQMIDTLKPDVLFTDIKMPIMDGLQLVKLAKETNPTLQVVILSGYSDFEYAKQAIKLGVHDYLLKPLDTEPLIELLISIRTDLNQLEASKDRNILSSAINGINSYGSLPSYFAHSHFALFLVCLGNLSQYTIPGSQASQTYALWERINWNTILPSLFGDSTNWWIIDERIHNQKFIVTTSSDNLSEKVFIYAKRLKDSLEAIITPNPVNICFDEKLIPYTEIHTLSQKLRLTLERKLAIGKSAVIVNDSLPTESGLALIDSTMQSKLSINLKSNNRDALKKDIYTLLEEFDLQNSSQRMVEKSLLQILKLISDNCQPNSGVDLIHMEYLINTSLSSASSLSHIKEDIWSVFDSLLQSEFLESHFMKDLTDRVEAYMRVHFSEEINIEDLSKKFNFNGTYLTRIFKKYKGESPVKYLISLRINEAKRLLECHPDIDIKQVSEVVGYTDSHYFSRIFRNTTGESPSDYKERILGCDAKS